MEDRYIVYKTNKVVRRVSLDEILYIESVGRRIRLETECSSLFYYDKLSELAASFDEILLCQFVKGETHVRWHSELQLW